MKACKRIAAVPLLLAVMAANDQSCSRTQSSLNGARSNASVDSVTISCHGAGLVARATGSGWRGSTVHIAFTLNGGQHDHAERHTDTGIDSGGGFHTNYYGYGTRQRGASCHLHAVATGTGGQRDTGDGDCTAEGK